MKKALGATLAIVVLIASSTLKTAHAVSPVAINISAGFPLLFADLNIGQRRPMRSAFTLGMEVTKSFSTMPLALGVFYEGVFKGDYGFLPLNHSGLSVYYYPFGQPYVLRNLDGNVSVTVFRPSPYLRMATGLSFFNFRDGGQEGITFGASAINYQIAGGFDYPLSSYILTGAQVSYLTTFGGISADEEPETVGATGFTFALRFSFIWQ